MQIPFHLASLCNTLEHINFLFEAIVLPKMYYLKRDCLAANGSSQEIKSSATPA